MNVKHLNELIKTFLNGGNHLKAYVYMQENSNNYSVHLTSTIVIDQHSLIKNGVTEIAHKISDIKTDLLNSDLFYEERRKLEDYERLKNMKFVLDSLKELNLQDLKEERKDPVNKDFLPYGL